MSKMENTKNVSGSRRNCTIASGRGRGSASRRNGRSSG